MVDYEVQVEDWNEADLKSESEDYPDANTPEFAVWLEQQKRLFEALLSDPARVEQVCRRSLLDSTEWELESLRKRFDVPEEDDLLMQASKQLDPSDVQHWRQASRRQMLYEESEFVRNRIQPYLTGCKLQNLETGDEIEIESHTPKDGETFVHSVEAFGTWAEDDDLEDADDLDEADDTLSDIVLTTIESENELSPHVKEFLQGYAFFRTVSTHVDPVTKGAEYTREQLAAETNDWIKKNPTFTKDDLHCLKVFLRRHGVPKLPVHDLVQDMRRKTFSDLAKAFLSGQYTAPPSIVA